MHKPVTIISDKVIRMARAMVYFAMCASFRSGATSGEIAGCLSIGPDGEAAVCHEGMVERVLRQLHRDGRVTRNGAHWYPVIDG